METNGNYKNAGFAIRFLALAEEGILTGITFFGLLLLVLQLFSSPAEKTIAAITAIITFVLISPVICALYHTFMVSKFGGTLGKLFFKLKVVKTRTGENISAKEAFYRFVIGYKFSTQLFGLGFIQITRNKDRKAWHDELFGTSVISTKDSRLGYLIFIISMIVFMALIVIVPQQIISLINKYKFS